MKSVFLSGVFRNSAIALLGVLVVLFLSAPFIDDLPNGDMIEAALLSAVMVCAVLAVGGRRRSLMIALLLASPTLGGKWVSHFWPSTSAALVYLVSALVFFIFVVSKLIQYVLRAPRVDANVLCAGLAGYLILGLLWMPAYSIVSRLNPSAFNLSGGAMGPAPMKAFDAFYFSFMTLTTVGYGDISPISKGARMLAVVEAITGLFYVAVLISRLVAIYSSPQPVLDTDADSQAK